MENTPFTVTNEDLCRLDAAEAVELLSELLWAEATRLGIPTNKVHVSANVNAPDNGVDAKVSGGTTRGDLIREGHTAYQIKSGESFQPQQEAVIRRELFGDQLPSKEHLKRRIRECLDDRGTYVLVCTGIDTVDRSLAEGHLGNLFSDCGYNEPKCEVWVQNQLCGFLTKYPSIALRLNGRDTGQLRTHASWAGDAEMGFLFQPGKKQLELISNLQLALRASGSAIQVHIRGDPGIGKTRLVLEATREPDLQPLVLYTNRPIELLESNFMSTLTRGDNHFAVILVVDECCADHRTQIWNRLASRGQRIKLVTIFNEWEDSSGVSFLEVPLLENERITEIIEGYSIPKDESERFAEFCSGSPRVAHVVGFNLQNDRDLLKPTATINIWERYVVGGDDAGSSAVSDRFAVLRHLALFKRFGYGDPVVAEARAISAIIQRGYPHITWPKFQEIVSNLRKRRILQGETTFYITPKLLHIWLWAEWWEHHGNGFNLGGFVEDLKGDLPRWYFEMFKYAEQSQAAQKTVRKLLGPNGPFQNREFFNSRLGGDFFLALTDVDAKEALACLERTVGSWSRDELFKFQDGRRGVIWALERIAVWKDHFCGAAKMLLKLAEAENETYSNNATGVFAELFSPGAGEVAPTEASPKERFPILEEALLSESEIRRTIALKACDSALEAHHFTREVGAEHQGFKPKPKLWTPKTYGEIWDVYRQVWNLLRRQLPSLPIEQRSQGVKTLFDKGIFIVSAPPLGPLILETWKEIFDRGWASKEETLEPVISLLRYRRNELNPEIVKGLEAIRDGLVGTGFSSLLKRYVAMDLLEDRFDDENQPTDFRERQIRALAEQCIARPELLRPELSWLVTDEAKNGYHFGYELAKLDENHRLLDEIVAAHRIQTTNTNPFFLSGYIRAIFETDPGKWEELLDEFASDDEMRVHVPELTWRSGMTDRAATRVLKLAQAGQMEVGRFGMFSLGSVIKDLSERTFRQWAEFLLSQPDATGVRILTNMLQFYYLSAGVKRELPADLVLKTLGHAAFFDNKAQFHAMDRHHWAAVGMAFAAAYPKDSLKLAQTIIDHFGEERTIVGWYDSGTHKILMEITKRNPREVWQLVSQRLGPPIDRRAFRLKSWLRGDRFSHGGEAGVLPLIPLDEIWKWVDANREKRAWYLATFVPKELFRASDRPCLAREVLIRYGADREVRNNLLANFLTEMWSGPASVHYRQKMQWLLDFKKDEPDHNVRRWIDEYVGDLQRHIDEAKVREERQAF